MNTQLIHLESSTVFKNSMVNNCVEYCNDIELMISISLFSNPSRFTLTRLQVEAEPFESYFELFA